MPDFRKLKVVLLSVVLAVLFRLWKRKINRNLEDSPTMKRGTQLKYCSRDERMKRILANSSFFSDPNFRYAPPIWAAASGWINLAAAMLKAKIFNWTNAAKLHRQVIEAPDKGLISIDWMDDAITRALPEDAPILIVLHTVTGSGPNSWDFLRHVPEYGWRACVFNRRGCANMELRTPKYSVMGCTEDTHLQVEEVKKKYPNTSFIGMAGLSAGSGLVISYLGKYGKNAPVDAATSLSPAYDIYGAFKQLGDKYPTVDKSIVKSMKETWLHAHENSTLLRSHDEETFEELMRVKTMHDFFDKSSVFAGYNDFDHFCEENNPMVHYKGVDCPTLVLNAHDDPVCLKENIREDIATDTHNYALVLTRTGSHVSFVEGAFGQRCWMTKVTMEFMSAVKAEKETEASAPDAVALQ